MPFLFPTKTIVHKAFWLILYIFITSNFSFAKNHISISKLKTGDIIFQNLDCGDVCDAIEKVTFGYNNLKFSHIGFIQKTDSGLYVYEAIPPFVKKTKFENFISRSSNTLYIGRLENKFNPLIKPSLLFIQSQMNVPYDNDFLYNNGKYYCSELLYDAFKSANQNKDFFNLEPMTFIDSTDEKINKIWEEYYKNLKMKIPQDEPGINPAGISRCTNFKWILPLK